MPRLINKFFVPEIGDVVRVKTLNDVSIMQLRKESFEESEPVYLWKEDTWQVFITIKGEGFDIKIRWNDARQAWEEV